MEARLGINLSQCQGNTKTDAYLLSLILIFPAFSSTASPSFLQLMTVCVSLLLTLHTSFTLLELLTSIIWTDFTRGSG